MATISTNQELKQVITTREKEDKPPYLIYHEQYTWNLDSVTLMPVNVSVQRNIT
jgi:hypothetical protein